MRTSSPRGLAARAAALGLAVLLVVSGAALPAAADELEPVDIVTTQAEQSAPDDVETPDEVETPSDDLLVEESVEEHSAPVESEEQVTALAADAPTIVVSKTTDLVAGEQITVTGTGFLPDAPATSGTRPPLSGKFGGVYVAFGKFAQNWKPSAGVPTSQRPTGPQPDGLKWFVSAADTGSVNGTLAINPDGSFTTTLTVTPAIAGAIADGNYGIYTYPGSGAVYPAFETYTPVSFAPTVVVSKTTGLVAGEVVTVTGAGFAPSSDTNGTRPPLSGRFGGVYVAFGKFAQNWKPSAGVPTSQRPTGPQPDGLKWFVSATDTGSVNGTLAINADGSFSTQLTVTPAIAGAIADGNYGIYTYPGSGASVARFETYTPVSFAPTVVVSKTTDLDEGEVVTVTGAGFAPSSDTNGTRPPLSGKFGGVYVAFGKFAQNWKPSAGVPTSQRPTGPQPDGLKWFVSAADTGSVNGTLAINADGSFSTQLTVTEEIAGAIADGNYGIYTYPGSGASVARFETYTPMAFRVTTPTPTPTPTETAAPVPQTAGSLSWGVRESWRTYVTGIAAGSISVSGGADSAGGAYRFPQSSASVDSAGLGTASYRGSVTFRGHGGALDVRLSDPIVRITSATSGVLSVSTYTGRVDFATLSLGSGTRQVDGTGAVVYSGVPATLTAAGSAAFGGQYPAGAPLDSVSFTVGSTNDANGTPRVVAASAVTTVANTPDATPPATTGISSESSGFTAGAQYTFTAGGFQPNEKDVLIVIYSDPVVLGTVDADANGVVTWTGALPAGLTGAHTLTFQGSVDRGIELTIAEAQVIGCPVDGAELSWGFKETFRAYIDGSIANGEWTVADGATYETPLFGWTGTGGYDAETGDADLAFTGSVRFTGHGGALDTTIANPRIVIDGDRAVLLLDVSGETQDGSAVSSAGVEFAELDLAAAQRAGGGDLVALTGIPAVLTAAGSAAFGTYEAGSELDPIDLSITVDPACLQPAADVEEPEVTTAVENASDTSAIVWIVLAILVALAAAIAAVLLVRRARRA